MNEPPPKRSRRPPSRNNEVIEPEKPKRRVRCGKCPQCRRQACGKCEACIEKKQLGKESRAVCHLKQCHVLFPNIKSSRDASSVSATIPPKQRVARNGSMKLGATTKGNSIPVCPIPTVSDYLKSEEATKSRKTAPRSEEPSATLRSFCGIPVPSAPEENTCACCNGERDDELEGQWIVLCDGPNCGREYHLQCTHPLLLEVPKDDWLCEDCSPDGSTANLIAHFRRADQMKAAFMSKRPDAEPLYAKQAAFIDHLLLCDCKQGNRPIDRFPRSELDRSALIHTAATEGDRSCGGRTRGGGDNDDPLQPSELVGCPVRVYSSVDCLVGHLLL